MRRWQRVAVLVSACIISLAIGGEIADRTEFGGRDPNASLPAASGPIWNHAAPSASYPGCTYRFGTQGNIELTWLSCNSGSGLLAALTLADGLGHVAPEGHTSEVAADVIEHLPSGATLVRTCITTEACQFSETLTLMGRIGTGWWKLQAHYAIRAEEPSEDAVAEILVAEWVKAGG